MNALTTYLRHVREEFAHIVWPSRRLAISHTLVVVIIAVVFTIIVATFDYVFGNVVSRIVGA